MTVTPPPPRGLAMSGRDLMRAFAARCLSGNTREAALEVFLVTMREDPEIAGIVEAWVTDAVSAAAIGLFMEIDAVPVRRVDTERRFHEQPRAPAAKALPEAMIARWGASVAAGFNFVLPDGSKLGDAKRGDLKKAAQTFSGAAKEAAQKSRWLLLIAQGLSEGQTVRERFKPLRLTELAIEAEKNTEIPA